MPVRLGYYAWGGGAGDIWWDYLHDRASWRMGSLVKDYGCRIRVYSVCHNPGIEDLFRYHPYVAEHVVEPWSLPTPESVSRYSNPIDGYLPLQIDGYFRSEYGMDFQLEQPEIYLSREEQAHLCALTGQRPLLVAQPFAGLSDRDGFDSKSFERMVGELLRIEPNCRIVVVGKNHERTHKYTEEALGFHHPAVINMIDRMGLRFAWHLIRQADGFIGCHSNLIRAAWDARKRNACVLPWPLMKEHLERIDGKYIFGFKYEETGRFYYPFDGSGERRFEQLDCAEIARWVLGRH